MSKFNVAPLILDINTIVKNSLEKYIKEYNSKYYLLEKTHKEILELPFVVSETNKNSKISSNPTVVIKTEPKNVSDEITKNITAPLVLEIEKIIQTGLNTILEEKKERYEMLEKTQKRMLELLVSQNTSVEQTLPPSPSLPKENITFQKIECKDCQCCSKVNNII